MNLESFTSKNLIQECREIQAGKKFGFHLELSLSEKALIYKYSVDGYIKLNQKLRESSGRNKTVFGKLLVQALQKLQDYTSVVYRKVQLTRAQQNIYRKAFNTGSNVTEPAFSST